MVGKQSFRLTKALLIGGGILLAVLAIICSSAIIHHRSTRHGVNAIYKPANGVVSAPASVVSDSNDGQVVKFAAPVDAGTPFVHPGILVSQSQLDFVRGKVLAHQDPWYSYYLQMQTVAARFGTNDGVKFASLPYTPHPVDYVRCPAGESVDSTTECNDETNDAIAAYTAALMYSYASPTDPKRDAYAQQAIKIINAWSTVFRHRTFNGSSDVTTANAFLQSSWAGAIWAKTAEIMRYTYTSPPKESVLSVYNLNNMFNKAYTPYLKVRPSGGHNWLMSYDEAAMSIGIFQDDHAMYSSALARWQLDVPTVIYLKSDVNPYPQLAGLPLPTAGSQYDSPSVTPDMMTTHWYSPNNYQDGLEGETCRDAGHMTMGFGSMMSAAETARLQGYDLYSAQAGRIVAGLEYNTGALKSFLANQTPANWPCSSPMQALKVGSGWPSTFEVAYNGFANRMGVSLPNTNQLLTTYSRPSSAKVNHAMDYEGLTNTEAPRGAACVVPSGQLGSVTMTVNAPSTGSYRVWARTNPANSGNNLFYAKVDDNCPVVLGGGASQIAGAWSWANYQNNDPTNGYTLNLTAGSHTVTLTGLSSNVQLSRLIVTNDLTCVPGDGTDPCSDALHPTPPSTVNAVAANASTVGLSWTGASAPTTIDHYLVFRNGAQLATTTDTKYTDTTVQASSDYSYTVQAVDDFGQISSASPVATVTTPYAPVVVDVVSPSSDQGTINLASTISDLSHVVSAQYVIDGNQQPITTTAPYSQDWDSTVVANGQHSLQAIITTNDGARTASSTLFFTVDNPDITPPSAPLGLSNLLVSQSSQTLNWQAATDNIAVTGYTVYRDGTTIGTTASPSFTDNGLSPTQTYNYTVVAFDAAGNTSGASQALTVVVPDVTPPTAPTNLVNQQTTQTSQAISWDAASDTVGVTGYTVYRGGLAIGTTSTTTFTDSTAAVGQTYTYTVSAFDAAGNVSDVSSGLSVTVADATAPTAPANLQGQQQTQTSQLLSWDAASDNVATTSYNLYRDGVLLTTTSQTSFTDDGLAVGQSYVYTVTATDAANNVSAPSQPLTVVVADVTAPAAPGNLQTQQLSQTSAGLQWDAASDNVAVTSYIVYRNGTAIGTSTSLSYTDANVAAGQTYSYTVAALDAAGNVSAVSDAKTMLVADVTAPSIVGSLSSQLQSQSAQTISWAAATDNVAVTVYTVQRDGVVIGTTASTSYTDNGLIVGRTYAYSIIASDAAGNAANASSALMVTVADVTPPTAPSGLSNQLTSQQSQKIKWLASSDNVGVNGYIIYRNGLAVGSTAASVLSFTDTGLTAAQTYTFTVAATDAAGNVSALSSPLSVTVADITAPAAPKKPSSRLLTQTSEQLTWTATTDNVGVTSYTLYRNGASIGTTSGTSFTDATVVVGQTYTYTVTASDAAGNLSSASPALTVTVADITAPAAPTNLTVSATTTTSISLNWRAATDNVGVVSYTVYRNSVIIATTTSLSYTDSGLASNTGYSYTVAASDAAGNSSPRSTVTNAKTAQPPDTTAPSAPTGLKSTAQTGTTVSLNWTAATDNVAVTSYKLARNGTIVASGLTGLTYTDSGLSNVTNYSYTLYALDAAGNVSAASTALIAKTLDSTAPTQPTNLSGYAVSTTATTFSWTASTDAVGVANYLVSRNGTQITSQTATTYSDSSLTPGTSYAYTVVAIDAAGNKSPAGSFNVSTLQPVLAAGTGLTGQYFNNKTLTGPALNRLDPNVNFDWAQNAPMTGINTDNFSIRWTGIITPTKTGAYTLYTDSNDGSRLWINDTLVIDKWGSSIQSGSATYNFTAGTSYKVRMEYFEGTFNASAVLSWTGPSITTKTAIPSSVFTSASSGLSAAYYSTNDLSGNPTELKPDSTINFNWGTAAPDTNLPTDNFSARWTGKLKAPATGSYTFYTDSDDGIRLWVNNQLLIDNWTPHTLATNNATVSLIAGTQYAIRMEYRELTGSATANLYWSYGSVTKTIIPGTAFLDR